MNETVREWVNKAEGDYATADRELRVTDRPNFDAVCFHSQQCTEKLMKAALIHMGIAPPRTHDLAFLDQLLRPVFPEWSWPVEELRFLSGAGVAFRYPGESADRNDAQTAFDLVTRIRERLLQLLHSRT